MKKPTTLAHDAFQNVKNHFMLLAGIYLIPGIATLLLSIFFIDEQMMLTIDQQGIVIGLLLIAVLIILNLLMGIAMVRAVSAPEETDIASAYQFAFQNLISYAVVGLMVSILVMVGFILLIIPGIILMVWYAFAYFVLLLEGKRGYSALKQSREYVRGKWWGVFGRMLFLLLIGIVIGIIVGIVAGVMGFNEGSVGSDIGAFILNVFMVPFSISYMYYLYRTVKDTTTRETIPEETVPEEPQTVPESTPTTAS